MPRITITEHSDTYSYQVRNNNYATVALPITAIWGPSYVADSKEANPDWIHFSAGYKGTTDFINTFKGPNVYLGSREKSYDYALKLLATGYDILVKRVDGLGARADTWETWADASGEDPAIRIKFVAKYSGSYGGKLRVTVSFNITTKTGTVMVKEKATDSPKDILLETVDVAFDNSVATETLPLITEAQFAYLDSISFATSTGDYIDAQTAWNRRTAVSPIEANLGSHSVLDYTTTTPEGHTPTVTDVENLIKARGLDFTAFFNYMHTVVLSNTDAVNLILQYNQQILYSRAEACIEELTDPLGYDWDVIIAGILDDQYLPKHYIESQSRIVYAVSTYTKKLVEVAIKSKCGCAFLGTPFNMPKQVDDIGIVDAISYMNAVSTAITDNQNQLTSTFAELVSPWCKTTLPMAGANSWITPEVAHLLLIINAQGIGGVNKWWMIPAGMSTTNVVHTPEYKIKKAYLDTIQNHDEGVCMNPLMEVSGRGFTCFGNSTLWNKPLGTYNALQNLSTRLLCNRVKQRIFDTALQILFRYNNADAYAHFYAGLSPLLDEMRSVGALTGNEYNPYGYKIIMNPDVVNLDRINANTAIGKVYLAVTGVIDDVQVDLYLLPPTGFMDTYD